MRGVASCTTRRSHHKIGAREATTVSRSGYGCLLKVGFAASHRAKKIAKESFADMRKLSKLAADHPQAEVRREARNLLASVRARTRRLSGEDDGWPWAAWRQRW